MVVEEGRLQLEGGGTLISPNLLCSDLHQLPQLVSHKILLRPSAFQSLGRRINGDSTPSQITSAVAMTELITLTMSDPPLKGMVSQFAILS